MPFNNGLTLGFMPACSVCGHEYRQAARFCEACGAALAARPAAASEQRKRVTVLFSDVTGSTALGERLDPESLRAVMARYFELARRVVERHGGTVEKFIGDAVMAVFGVPVLHEDDALRAVRAAAELQAELAGLNATLERDYATALELRIGVNTGEVVTGTEERLATGDAVNVAARLEQAARPGEILLGPDTVALVRDAAVVESAGPLELKGKAAAITAYRLESVSPTQAPSRPGSAMVGRTRELERLRAAMAQAVTDGSCQLFTLLGSAGVGKSRLSHEFLTASVRPPSSAERASPTEKASPTGRSSRSSSSCSAPSRRGGSTSSASARAPLARSRLCSARTAARRRRRRSRGRCAGCSRPRPNVRRSWRCSTTSTGVRRRSSISSTTSPT